MTLINSPRLPIVRQVRAQLTRAFLLNSAMIDRDLGETIDALTALVVREDGESFETIYTRLQACLIALDEGIKLPSFLEDRVDELAAIIGAE